MPVGRARAAVASTRAIGTAAARGVPARSGTRGAAGSTAASGATSTTLPQAWHSPQRPAHFRGRHPHSEHSYTAAAAALLMARRVAAGTDSGKCKHLQARHSLEP
jgi:hypothetical protein